MRILIVEDETLVSMLIEEMVEELGHEVVGPASTIPDSLQLISECDIAILDVNLGQGVTSFEVADALTAQSTPFMFSTGDSAGIEPRFFHVPKLLKPFDAATLAANIENLK